MATTTNFGWVTPDNTDLVKDGASAIRTLGSSIDSSMGDLKGGTTGQVLSKTTGTDMDFTWVTTDDTNAIQNAIVDAKGDLIGATAADTPARLAVGANDLILTADSAESTGLKYTGGWTTWTPTFTALTVGNGTVTARYQKIGKTVNFFFFFQMGSTSSMGTNPNFTLPIASVNYGHLVPTHILDSGTANYAMVSEVYSNLCLLTAVFTNGTYPSYSGLTATVPFTWAVNDTITMLGTYEVA